MVTRKVQQVGGGTYTVSLPKEWAESVGIAAGDEVHLQRFLDEVLVVEPERRTWESAEGQSIPVGETGRPYLDRIVRAAYEAGLEAVTIRVSDPFTDAERAAMTEAARTLAGMTVVEQGETEVTLRSVIDPTDCSAWQSVRQLSYVALTMHRDALDGVFDPAATGDVGSRADEIERLHALIRRVVRRGLSWLHEADELGLTTEELLDVWITARQLRRVADEAERILGNGAAFENPSNPDLVDDFRSTGRSARAAVSDAVAVMVGDAEPVAALRALEAHDTVQDSIAEFHQRHAQSPTEGYGLYRLFESVARTAEYGSAIANQGIQAAVRRDEFTSGSNDEHKLADGPGGIRGPTEPLGD